MQPHITLASVAISLSVVLHRKPVGSDPISIREQAYNAYQSACNVISITLYFILRLSQHHDRLISLKTCQGAQIALLRPHVVGWLRHESIPFIRHFL